MVSPEQLQALQEAKNDLKELNKQVRELKQLETIGKQITGNFGSSIKLLDNAVAKGLIGPDGIAKDSNEIAANQAKFLAEQVLGNKQNAAQLGIAVAKQRENLKAQEEIFKLRADEVKLLANRDAALKSMAGMSLQLMQAVEKEKLSQEKILATLRQKLEVVKAESALKDAQRDLEVERANQERINKLAEANLSISERQVELAQAKSNAINKEFEAQEKLINLQDKELALRDRISKARAKLQNQGTLSNFDSQIASLQNTLAEMQFFPGLSSEEDRRKIREQIINLEFEKQMEVIDQKRTQALSQFFSEIEAVDRKKAAVEREIKQQDKLISDRKAFALLEEQNLAQQQSIDIKKLEQEKSNLQAQLGIIDKEEALAKEQNKAAAIRDEFIKKEALMRIDSLVIQSEIVNKFAEAVGKDTPFVKAIEALVGPDAAAKIAEATSPQKLNLDTNRLRVGVDLADMLRGQVRDITSGIGQKGRDAKRGTIGADITAQEKLIELTKQEQALTMQLTEAKNTAAIKELENERQVLDQKLANIALEREAVEIENMAALDALDREEQKVIENYQAKIDALNRERDMISQFASDVSLAIGGELKNSINGFFQGIAEGKSVLDSAKDAFGQFMQKIIGSIQEKLTEKFISPVIDSILGGIFAGGGPVQLAGGGAMRRDRVPALLEPGEFVIRKPMAKAIGGPALSAMNGHGKGLGMPTIDVQINNSGQPKDAEAQVKPNMDVNKMVVEIVTRDLRNNGPIRKTLRGDS